MFLPDHMVPSVSASHQLHLATCRSLGHMDESASKEEHHLRIPFLCLLVPAPPPHRWTGPWVWLQDQGSSKCRSDSISLMAHGHRENWAWGGKRTEREGKKTTVQIVWDKRTFALGEITMGKKWKTNSSTMSTVQDIYCRILLQVKGVQLGC